MGEWSKTVGEYGEETVAKFLELIGWGHPPKGISIPCVKALHEKETHGLDFLYTYPCPLVDEVLKNAIVSVKYTSEVYPNSPSSKFKKHLEDLAYSIECFRSSEQRSNINKGFFGVKKTEDIGVLFWLSNNPDTYDDLIEKVLNIRFDKDYNFKSIYIVDNKRITFIFESIMCARFKFPNSKIEFEYLNTGKNNNPLTKKNSGSILPLEYINSSVLLLRIVGEKKILGIFTINNFNESDLKRLIGLAQDISKNWPDNISIFFPNYNGLTYEPIVRQVKTSFEDKEFIERVAVESYKLDYRR